MDLIRAGLRYGDDQTSAASPEFGAEISIEYLEFLDGILAEFEGNFEFAVGKTAPRLVGIGPIDDRIAVEVVHAGEIRRRARIAVAELGGSRNKDTEIHEFSAVQRQVVEEPLIDGRAGLFPVRFNERRPGWKTDGGRRGKSHKIEIDIQCLADLERKSRLPRRCET